MIIDKETIQDLWKYRPDTIEIHEVVELDFMVNLPMFVRTVYLYDEEFKALLTKQFPIIEGARMSRTQMYTTIDITTVCNLSCNNCQRASHLNGLNITMAMKHIEDFIQKHKEFGKNLTVKILGGEPTMHPDIEEIIFKLKYYFEVGIVTNGTTKWKNKEDIWVEDTLKTPHENPMFYTTFDAPIDDPEYDGIDYSNGCRTATHCGNCVTVDGHYPCNVGGTIDRLLFNGENGGDIYDVNNYDYRVNFFNKMCQYCGVFKFTGYHNKLRPPLRDDEVRSKTFKFLEKYDG